MDRPKQRPLKLDAHTLAYLGDLVSMYEKTIQQKVKDINIENIKKPSISKSSNTK
jgi:hypothetical protein